MHEGVLVANAEAGDPPLVHVRHVAIGDVHAAPAARVGVVAVIEKLEPVEVVQIPADGGVGAVDLQRVQRLVPARVSRGFEQSERAVRKVAVKNTGVVDGDFLLLAGGGVHALLDERLGDGGNVGNAAVEPDGGVDAVGEQVAGDATAGGRGVQTPKTFAALGEIGADGPVLQEVGAVMKNLAELAAIDNLLGQGDGRDAPVVVPDRIRHTGFLHGIDHRRAFLGGAGQRLFAKHHLTRLGGGDGYLSVLIVGCANVDGVNVIALDQLAPISFVTLVAPLFGEGFGAILRAAAHRLEHRPMAEIREKVTNALVPVRVSPAHEAVADESNVKGFLFAHDL